MTATELRGFILQAFNKVLDYNKAARNQDRLLQLSNDIQPSQFSRLLKKGRLI